MASKQVNRSLFKPDADAVLTRGLNAMTKACDSLSNQNEQLLKDIEGLKRKITRLQERVIIDNKWQYTDKLRHW